MRRSGLIFFTTTILLISLGAVAQKVVESELGKGRRIRFVNYRGRYTRIMPVSEIRGIGGDLGTRTASSNTLYAGSNHFSVVAARGAGKLYNADIFYINEEADIVDIRAIRLILSAYLEKRYGYSSRDGMILARYVTYYNAVYRGRVDYFGGVYNPEVMGHLSRRTAGLSRFYYDWPGRSRILIPVSDEGGKRSLTSINTGELSGKKVNKDLRSRDDKGLKDRKDMTDLRNRQNEERKRRLARLRKEADDRRREQERRRKKLEDDRKKLNRTNRELDKREADQGNRKKKLLGEKDPKKARKLQEDINKNEKDIKKLKDKQKRQADDVKKRQKDVDDGKKKVDNENREIKKRENIIKKEDDSIKKSRDQIKKDENKKGDDGKKATDKPRQDRRVFNGTLYYLKISEILANGHYNNIMFLIDPLNRKVLLRSPFSDICGRKYDIFADGVVVIGHKGGHTFQHFLVLLDHKTLKAKATGTDNVYYRSFVEIRNNFIYAIYRAESGYRLGRFNSSLVRVAGSDVPVDQDSFISFYNDFLYINSPKKNILVLDSKSLKRVGGISP